jgi:hypothetical protein
MKLLLLNIFCALISLKTLFATPKQLIIIRNAESNQNSDSLSAKGRQRAAALQYKIILTYGIPISLYSINPNSAFDSRKPYDTLLPLAWLAQQPVQSFYLKNQIDSLVNSIMDEMTNNNKLVVLSLTNDLIPLVTEHLGVKQAPKTWDNDIFDRMWVITFNEDGTKTFENKPQALLFGDSTN